MVAGRFRLLGEPNRLRLLIALESGKRTVSEPVRLTGCTQANASRHLQILTGAGILGRRRQGLHVYYFIADETIFDLCDTVCGSLQERLDGQARAFEQRGKRAGRR